MLTSYTGQLPGSAVKKIIPSADAKEKYATVVGVDDGATPAPSGSPARSSPAART